MNPKISVIVPVYNTGELLRDTVDSILSQTFRDFELILIDDGSKDVCPAICDEYAKRDNRVVVIHQKNSGICGARNAGISVARGEYITFCDHDDLYMPEKLETEYRLAMETKADIVNVGSRTEFDNGKIELANSLSIRCLSRAEITRNLFVILDGHVACVWKNLYRRAAFKEHFMFDTKYTRGHEDINFNFLIMKNVQRFAATDAVLYRHIVRESLSTSAKIHIETIEGYVDSILNYHSLVKSFSVDLKKEQSGYSKILSQMIRSMCVYMLKVGLSYSKFKETLQPLRPILEFAAQLNIASNHTIPYKDRFFFATLERSERLAYALCKFFVMLKGT